VASRAVTLVGGSWSSSTNLAAPSRSHSSVQPTSAAGDSSPACSGASLLDFPNADDVEGDGLPWINYGTGNAQAVPNLDQGVVGDGGIGGVGVVQRFPALPKFGLR